MRENIFAIYNAFRYDLFKEMERKKLKKCWFHYYHEMPHFGRFCFQAIDTSLGMFNISICLDKFVYKYYDELVDAFKSHENWLFELGWYDYDTDTFDIVFKRPGYGLDYGLEIEEHPYSISNDGIITRLCVSNYYDNMYAKIRNYRDSEVRNIYDDIERRVWESLRIPVCKELPTFKFDSLYGGRVPNLSKPPIFNPPATVCYWTDGTRTVVKCQEGDTYSKEAGLALCYMKKVLGNTSRDLNKKLHKYIPEEVEEG